MFVALNESKERVLAWDVERSDPCVCPECQFSVLLKHGRIVVPHFAHRPGATCQYGAGESMRHHEMKWQMSEFFGRNRCLFEVTFGKERRADLIVCLSDYAYRGLKFGNRLNANKKDCPAVVVECQHSSLSIDEWNQRTDFYNRLGFPVLWIWDDERLQRDADGDYRISNEIKHAHRCSYGSIYVLQRNGELYACNISTFIRESWIDYQGTPALYRQRIKNLSWRRIVETKPQRRRGPETHLLAHFGEGVWWKGKNT